MILATLSVLELVAPQSQTVVAWDITEGLDWLDLHVEICGDPRLVSSRIAIEGSVSMAGIRISNQ